MTNVLQNDLEDIDATQLSSISLKEHIGKILARSCQCKAILECVNKDTGEYRLVLQGILDK